MAFLSPNTTYPLIRPAIKVSILLSFPELLFFCRSNRVLYSDTNLARLSECCFVARRIVRIRVDQLYVFVYINNQNQIFWVLKYPIRRAENLILKKQTKNSLSSSKQNSHYKRMGEPNFGSINQPIPCTFNNSQIIMVCRISKYTSQRHNCEQGKRRRETEGKRGTPLGGRCSGGLIVCL